MHAYRFRITTEEQDDFLREIDMLANHSFEDFHNTLVSSAGLEGKELASFFICDNRWRKLKEYTLIDMQADEAFDGDDEEVRDRKPAMPVNLMSNTRIKDAIIDPHQQLLYEYDFLHPKTLYIQLIRILASDSSTDYPLIVRSDGVLAKTGALKLFQIEELDEEYMLKDIESLDDEFTIDEDDMENSPESEPSWQ